MNVTPQTPVATSPRSGVGGIDPGPQGDILAFLDAAAVVLVAAARPNRELVTVPLGPRLLQALAAGGHEGLRRRAGVTFERPADGRHLFGIGEARVLSGTGEISGAISAIAATAVTASAGVDGEARPRFFGGGRFDPGTARRDDRWTAFRDWQFRLPAFLITCVDGEAYGSLTWAVSSTDEPADVAAELAGELAPREPAGPAARDAMPGLDEQAWKTAVREAVTGIGEGVYDKVVLARAEDVTAAERIDTASVLSRLTGEYPGCYVFSYGAGDALWLGASPELLVSLEAGVARAASLAGSRPRGRFDEEDCRLAFELLESDKERAEHEFVVCATRAALAPVALSLEAPREPGLMRMTNIQHLYTPIRCEVVPGTGILDLVARMHPTPAVGAWPREAAFSALPRLEQMDRGWYAAPIGWLDLNGDGEFAVALRSALVTGNTARLYAGAGIVAGSVPGDELEETRLKLRPLADALQER